MKKLAIMILAFASFASANPQCSIEYQKNGFNADMSLIKDKQPSKELWVSLLKVYESHLMGTGCDDGFMSEGFSDVIPRVLSSHWKDNDKLFDMMSKNKQFGDFVLRHIDATSDSSDLKSLSLHAKEECSKKYQSTCKQILANIKSAGG